MSYPLHAQPGGWWQVLLFEIQLSPQALPVVQILQHARAGGDVGACTITGVQVGNGLGVHVGGRRVGAGVQVAGRAVALAGIEVHVAVWAVALAGIEVHVAVWVAASVVGEHVGDDSTRRISSRVGRTSAGISVAIRSACRVAVAPGGVLPPTMAETATAKQQTTANNAAHDRSGAHRFFFKGSPLRFYLDAPRWALDA